MNYFENNGRFADDLILYILTWVNDSQTIYHYAILVNVRWSILIKNNKQVFPTANEQRQRIVTARKELQFDMKRAIVNSMLSYREPRDEIDSFEFYHHYTTAHVLRSTVKELEFKLKQDQLRKLLQSRPTDLKDTLEHKGIICKPASTQKS